MAFDDNIPVYQGIFYDAAGNPVDVILDGSTYRLAVDAVSSNPTDTDREAVVVVDYLASAVSATGYYLLVDLDNAAGLGPYKHTLTNKIELAGLTGSLLKSSTSGLWSSYVGVITAINGVNATIAYFNMGTIHDRDTGRISTTARSEFFPITLDLAITGGSLDKIAAGFTETTNVINTGIMLDDVSGVARTPAIGDLLLKVEKNGGSGTVDAHFSIWYLSE